MASESPFPPTARCLSHVFQSVDEAAWELKAPTPPALTRGLDKAGDLGRFPGEVVFISAPVCTSARPALSTPHAATVPPALPAWLSRGLHWTSSTHSAGNHPMWPRALPSQKPPSPMLRTRNEEEDSVSGRGLGLVFVAPGPPAPLLLCGVRWYFNRRAQSLPRPAGRGFRSHRPVRP